MKVIDKKVGDITYIKYRINLPKQVVEESDLLNKKLVVRKFNGKIIIEKGKY